MISKLVRAFKLKKEFQAHCRCLDNPLQNNWKIFEEIVLGVDRTNGRFGEVLIRICPECKFIWLRYHAEYEAFTASGRWYLGRLCIKDYKIIVVEKAASLLEFSNPCFYGGSYYKTNGLILKKPKGNIKVDL